jgi:hypothetical protein
MDAALARGSICDEQLVPSSSLAMEAPVAAAAPTTAGLVPPGAPAAASVFSFRLPNKVKGRAMATKRDATVPSQVLPSSVSHRLEEPTAGEVQHTTTVAPSASRRPGIPPRGNPRDSRSHSEDSGNRWGHGRSPRRSPSRSPSCFGGLGFLRVAVRERIRSMSRSRSRSRSYGRSRSRSRSYRNDSSVSRSRSAGSFRRRRERSSSRESFSPTRHRGEWMAPRRRHEGQPSVRVQERANQVMKLFVGSIPKMITYEEVGDQWF